MDPLSALAIAAAVVQFAEVGRKLLIKAWRKYREFDGQKAPNEIWLQETELEDSLKELALFTRTIKESTDRVVSPQATPRPADSQLVLLCEECESIAMYFQDVLKAAEKRPVQRVFDNTLGKETDLTGLWAPNKIEKMKNRLITLQKCITDNIVLCLWEDSKQTKTWEDEFGRKMDEMFSLLKQMDGSIKGHSLFWVDTRIPDGSLNREVPSDSKKVQENFEQTLQSDSQVVEHIYRELTSKLWRRDWQPEDPLSEAGTGHVLAQPVDKELVNSMTDALRFESFNRRQKAIPRTFQSTYHWIFDRQPKNSPEGLPLWHSFPDWLEGASDSIYWITGKPGSGKSTMMKYIAEDTATLRHLQQWSDPLPVIVVSYYAWNAGHTLQKSVDGLRRTILSQAVSTRPDLLSLISPRRWSLANALPRRPRFPSWESWEVKESFDLLSKGCGPTLRLAIFIDGLDEFDVDPRQIVKLIEGISSTSPEFLKLCVASRPWTQFDDAYSHAPLLRMHLLTKDDIVAFIAGQFDKNRGFSEILNIYPTQAQELKEEIVSRARGVFLWVSIVVQSLLLSFSDGESLYDLQATLSLLPSDISSLYDVIWERIEGKNRHDGSWMIQVLTAAEAALEGLTMWLADESRSSRADVDQMPVSFEETTTPLLKRKLASRTRGILEIVYDSGTSLVDFSHRTARDWARQAEVWDKIRASYHREEFNPCLVLFEAETLTAPVIDGRGALQWGTRKKALWYASKSCETEPSNNKRLVQLMDFFDKTIQHDYEKASFPSHGMMRAGKEHRTMSQNNSLQHNKFMGLPAQYCILPYVQAKIGNFRTPSSLKVSPNYTSLLDCAVFGWEFFSGYDVTDCLRLPPVSVERRLEMVRFLVDKGSTPGPRFGEYLAKERARCSTSSHPVLLNYYDEVFACIKAKASVRQQAKGALGWVSSFIRSPR